MMPKGPLGRRVNGVGERVLALATGKTRQELYLACPNDRPNHIGMAVQRHIRAGRIQERDGNGSTTAYAVQRVTATRLPARVTTPRRPRESPRSPAADS